MSIVSVIRQIGEAGSEQLIIWVSQILPQVFLFLIFLNAVTRMVGRARVERLAARCGSNALLRYLVLPFLSAVVLGNPMAISMGRYLPEEYKPAYFASASYHCHTNSGVFSHINPAELFLWLGIADGVLARRLDIFPLALRYLLAGLAANFLSGFATELITRRLEAGQGRRLARTIDLGASEDAPPSSGESPLTLSKDNPDSLKEEPEPGPVSPYRGIMITRGDGGYGGPVTITPTADRHIVLCMTAAGTRPEPLDRILALSGMTAVDGSQTQVPDEEVALAVIDCAGTLRCGIYPGKGIPTVNLLATGKSGPLAKYMTEDLYVSAVTSAQVHAADGEKSPLPEGTGSGADASPAVEKIPPAAMEASPAVAEVSSAAGEDSPAAAEFSTAAAVSSVISIFHQSAREAVRTCLDMLLPFMGFAALFIGFCKGTGLSQFLAGLMEPMGGSLPGLFLIGFLCSLPGLSAVLGAGAVAAQMFAALIGSLIASGSIAPAMALPALFAINCQCACDFIPVGMGMMEAKSETTQLGVTAVTLSRFLTGWLRILIALLFSIDLYAA